MTRPGGIAAILLGLALPGLALVAWAPPWRIELDGWDNHYLDTYPWDFGRRPKHLVIGTGCWTWTTEAYMTLGKDETHGTQRAALHNALNAVLEERGGPDETFHAFGRPDVDFARHLISIRQATEQGAVRSLIYINNPGSLQAFTRPANALAVLPVLAAIEREHPRLAPDVEIFRGALLASAGYREGLAENAAMSPWKRFGERLSTWADGLTRRWRGVVRSLAFTAFPGGRDRHETETLFQATRANYDNPVACAAKGRGLMAPEQYWIGAGGEDVWRAWLRLAAGLAAERGIPFIYYVPPHLNVPQDRYEREFRPYFVERVEAVLAGFPNAAVIDHAVGHGLSPCDQVYDTERHFAAGYLFNFAGKLKQARLLLADLAERGVVGGGAERFRVPTLWEASLPDLPYRPTVLSEAESERVREELIAEGEWRRSLPAGEARP